MRNPKRWLRGKPISENVAQCSLRYRYTEISVNLTVNINDVIITKSLLLQKLTGSQLIKNFPPFCGTRRFITAVTSVRHLFLY